MFLTLSGARLPGAGRTKTAVGAAVKNNGNQFDSRARKLSKRTAKERLTEFLKIFGKDDDVLVVINADPDALASAVAVKKLLRYRVKNLVIAYPNEIRRLSNLAMVELLKIQADRLQNVKPDDFTKKVLLDSQPPHLPVFEGIKFDAIIDHHPPTKGWEAAYVDIRKDYGATASMLVEYLRAAEVKPPVAVATALFYAIKVDTQNFEKKTIPADAISFRYLYNLVNHNLVRKIELSELRQSELNYFKLALNDYKISKKRLYLHMGRVRSPDILVILADFFNRVRELSWVLVSGIHGEWLVVIFRCDGYKKNAGKLAADVFGKLGVAGGHRESARAEVPVKILGMDGQEFTTQTLKRLATKHLSKMDPA